MDGVHEADVPVRQVHQDRLGPGAVSKEPHALQQGAVGDAGSREDDVLARGQLGGGVDFVRILDAHALHPLGLLLVLHHQPCQDLSIEAAERRRRQHPFRGAADSHDRVDPGPAEGHADAGREVAVGNEADACAGSPNILDQPGVPGAVQNHHHQVLHVAVQPLGDGPEVVLDRGVDIDDPLGGGADDDLLHVAIRSIQQPALFGAGQHRNGSGRPGGAKVGALQRVDGNIHLVRNLLAFDKVLVLADLFPDVEHGGLVPLTFSDHDGPLHGNAVHDLPHHLHRGLIGELPVANAHGAGGGDGGLFHHLEECAGKVL